MVKGIPEIGADLVGPEKRISIETMQRYSGKSGIHADEEAGKARGLGGALVQGGQLVGYLNQLMTLHFGEAYLKGGDISVSFVKPVRAGNVIRARGVVKELESERGKTRVRCDVWLENQDGDKVTVGTATALG